VKDGFWLARVPYLDVESETLREMVGRVLVPQLADAVLVGEDPLLPDGIAAVDGVSQSMVTT
jgi:hypothetical protein